MAFNLKKQLKTSAAVMALATGLLLPSMSVAQEITLRSTDGTINVTGDFVDFRDDTYVVRTALGELRIAASSMVCEGAACPTFEDITADVTIVGSNTIGQGMMPLLMTGFASALDADAELTNASAGETVAKLISDGGFGDEIGAYLVSSTDDNDAFEALLAGEANIGMSARRITVDEARALRDDGAGSMVSPNQEHIVAVDSMVVVTHADNPVNQLDQDQLAGIFSGQITNWSQVGGVDKPINVISQPSGSASYEYFMDYLYGEERPAFLPQGIAADDQVLSNTIFQDRNAIGYLGYAFQRGAKPLTIVNECGLATTPDAFSAKTEEYTLSRRMYLYNRADNLNASTQQFIDFVMSNEADAVIGKSGFIDLGILRRSQAEGDARRANLVAEMSRFDIGFEGEIIGDMLSEMDEYDRLSTTFRFRTGSSRLDERGRLDMQRLIAYLDRAPDGTEIRFVGFTDDVGAFDANQRLAEQRAAAVMDEMRSIAGELPNVTMTTAGYGEIAPSACNVSERGRGINRRVEVWISKSVES
ncbi:phosphate ABC transporter substrate-binding protein (PhoT family) [Yoonia maricola]|uniref:Phosphate ABC transporter substrate-binding protein (PhoT family) n=1 Tax=Yoonia maricola TaxID=420999 RepID=A0A2M8WLH2_9RHOB|nr:phosphate ABC transporter substrate-binding/OmpA family protein [Yoonia maricola]PJI91769.1 phosphate ABC transporter substrate-binding protein (PhoT family) [Yoonia maricola]